jgi:hypothetical protein
MKRLDESFKFETLYKAFTGRCLGGIDVDKFNESSIDGLDEQLVINNAKNGDALGDVMGWNKGKSMKCNQEKDQECDNINMKKCTNCPGNMLCLCTRPEVIEFINKLWEKENNE